MTSRLNLVGHMKMHKQGFGNWHELESDSQILCTFNFFWFQIKKKDEMLSCKSMSHSNYTAEMHSKNSCTRRVYF